MKPARWNSIRANKKWRILTTTGTALILACWIHSLLYYCILDVPLASKSLVCGTGQSTVGLGYSSGTAPLRFHVEKMRAIPWEEFDKSLKIIFPLPEIVSPPGQGMILIPFWLILLTFLGVQYALLPKTLPPPKGEGNLPGTP